MLFFALMLAYLTQLFYFPSREWSYRYWTSGAGIFEFLHQKMQAQGRFFSLEQTRRYAFFCGFIPYIFYILLGWWANSANNILLLYPLVMVGVTYVSYQKKIDFTQFERLWHYTLLPLILLLLPAQWFVIAFYFGAMYIIHQTQQSFWLENIVSYLQQACAYFLGLIIGLLGKTEETWPLLRTMHQQAHEKTLYQLLELGTLKKNMSEAQKQQAYRSLIDRVFLILAVLHLIRTFID